MTDGVPKLAIRGLTVHYGRELAVRGLDLAIPGGSIYAIIGPARSGKTSVLRTINQLSIEVDGATVEGHILVDGQDVSGRARRPGARSDGGSAWCSRRRNRSPAPSTTIWCTARAWRACGRASELARLVEESLRAAQLWDEVKDRLGESAFALSGGQQQRLCLARTLALGPEIVLLDEPCSGLDPISTLKIEETMRSLRTRFTWVLVTNNTKQAARVSDRTAFMLAGELVEEAPTDRLFTTPRDVRTGDYVEGRFG